MQRRSHLGTSGPALHDRALAVVRLPMAAASGSASPPAWPGPTVRWQIHLLPSLVLQCRVADLFRQICRSEAGNYVDQFLTDREADKLRWLARCINIALRDSGTAPPQRNEATGIFARRHEQCRKVCAGRPVCPLDGIFGCCSGPPSVASRKCELAAKTGHAQGLPWVALTRAGEPTLSLLGVMTNLTNVDD